MARDHTGCTVEILGGSYTQALIPQHSGTASQPLVFEAYGNETVTTTGTLLAPAIDISGRGYVTIQGLTISNVQRWRLAVNAHHNTIVGNVAIPPRTPASSFQARTPSFAATRFTRP